MIPGPGFVRSLLCAFAFVLGLALAQDGDSPEVRLAVTSNIADTYQAGSEHELNAQIRLVDPAETVERGVLFLNVIEVTDDGTYPQAMHIVFASAETDADAFGVPLDGDALRAGIEASVRVRLRDRAPEGRYAIVFQVFEGEETNPHQVRPENRAAIASFEFDVVR